jgi:hypothetical protein
MIYFKIYYNIFIKRGDSIEDIIELTELSKDKILELKRKYHN